MINLAASLDTVIITKSSTYKNSVRYVTEVDGDDYDIYVTNSPKLNDMETLASLRSKVDIDMITINNIVYK